MYFAKPLQLAVCVYVSLHSFSPAFTCTISLLSLLSVAVSPFTTSLSYYLVCYTFFPCSYMYMYCSTHSFHSLVSAGFSHFLGHLDNLLALLSDESSSLNELSLACDLSFLSTAGSGGLLIHIHNYTCTCT